VAGADDSTEKQRTDRRAAQGRQPPQTGITPRRVLEI
jgi:hypothetical protein